VQQRETSGAPAGIDGRVLDHARHPNGIGLKTVADAAEIYLMTQRRSIQAEEQLLRARGFVE
jgi:hypothetical protein